ncbi:hypothetical protein Barb6_00657 [Bacteroidales bacterium Barb6]|nr:hypothetical protein Barb6_00657 [Bacteroidales bacterium Barb6]
MKNHSAHAAHNESVCNYLGKHEKYSDWVITAAFYSALHFVRHLMLPQNVNGVLVDDFETLYGKLKLSNGRHTFQLYYVQREHPSITKAYTRLYEMSVNTRYNKYEYKRDDARAAKLYMEHIKSYVVSEKEKAV